MKTDKQMLLEIQHGKPVEDILRESFAAHQGRRNMAMLVAVDLEVSDATIYNWCEDLGINIDDYRRPVRDGEAPRFPLDSDDRASEC